MGALLLDTCALLWTMNDDRLAPAARAQIEAAGESNALHVSPISAWEIATLVRRGRIGLAMAVEDWFDAALATPGVGLARMEPRVLIQSAALPGNPPADPADRIIIATARAQGLTIVTRDRKILDYGSAGHVRAIAC